MLEALADFFGVNPNFFFNTEAADRIAAQLELYAAMRDTEVRQIALRAADLSPDSLRAIAEIIEHWRQLEGIPQGKREGRTPSTRPPEQTEEKGTGDSGPESAA